MLLTEGFEAQAVGEEDSQEKPEVVVVRLKLRTDRVALKTREAEAGDDVPRSTCPRLVAGVPRQWARPGARAQTSLVPAAPIDRRR